MTIQRFIPLLFLTLSLSNILLAEAISEFDLSPSEKLSLTIQTHFNTPCYDVTLQTKGKPSALVWIAPVDVNKVINDNIIHISPHYGKILSAKKEGSIISFLIKSGDFANYIRRDLLKDRASREGTQSSFIFKSIHDFSYPHNPLPKLEDVFSFSATSADGILKYYLVDESGQILPKNTNLDNVGISTASKNLSTFKVSDELRLTLSVEKADPESLYSIHLESKEREKRLLWKDSLPDTGAHIAAAWADENHATVLISVPLAMAVLVRVKAPYSETPSATASLEDGIFTGSGITAETQVTFTSANSFVMTKGDGTSIPVEIKPDGELYTQGQPLPRPQRNVIHIQKSQTHPR